MLSNGWLESPGITADDDFVETCYGDGNRRNYSYHYDKSIYTSLWTAYPLYSSTVNGNNDGGWRANPGIDNTQQINVWDGPYSVNVGSTTSEGYSSASLYYARGHQIPDADRDNDATMLSQTYYATNSTPQIHSGFNSGIWSSLENGVRDVLPSTDTIYVVTGPAFNKVGESKPITYITPKNDTKACPVPNYYWKVVLKVKRDGKGISEACAVGFWLEHRAYSAANGEVYANYAVSVDQIEQWTGLDLFVNLPDALESVAETNSDWPLFQNF